MNGIPLDDRSIQIAKFSVEFAKQVEAYPAEDVLCMLALALMKGHKVAGSIKVEKHSNGFGLVRIFGLVELLIGEIAEAFVDAPAGQDNLDDFVALLTDFRNAIGILVTEDYLS